MPQYDVQISSEEKNFSSEETIGFFGRNYFFFGRNLSEETAVSLFLPVDGEGGIKDSRFLRCTDVFAIKKSAALATVRRFTHD